MVSKFSIYVNQQLSNAGTNLEEVDLLHNFTSLQTQLMNGAIPWRGAREKDPLFVQLLIEAFSKPGDVVLDCYASTGTCILYYRYQYVNHILFLLYIICQI